MNQQYIHKILKSDYLMLLPIMALAFYLAFIPHHAYPYLVHLDEWIHLASSNQIINQATTVGLVDPFSGGAPMFNQLVEVGFHSFWVVFHQISGISWLDIFRYFPGITFIITVLSVYVLAQRQGFGWEAALFTTLIPTRVGILGPGFLVPVAMGLLFISLSLFLAFNFRSWWSYLVLLILTLFLVSMHSVSAVILIIILAPYILLNLKGNFRHSLGITLTLATPFLVALVLFPWMFQMLVLPGVTSLLSSQLPLPFIQLPQIIPTYGYLPIIFCLVGSGLLALRGGKRNYGLILGLLVLLLVLTTFFTLHYGDIFIYYRGLMYVMLMMSIVAGAGLNWVKNIRLPVKLAVRLRVPLVTKNMGNILCLVLVGLTLAIAIPSHQDTPYYHIIDNEDYQAFVWIKENIDGSYTKAILNPWKGSAFSAITGKYVYTYIGAYPYSRDRKAYSFLQDSCKDTAFLKENSISIVYTRGECQNPDLVEVRQNIYLLKETKEAE